MKLSPKKLTMIMSVLVFLFYFGWENLQGITSSLVPNTKPAGVMIDFFDIGQGDSILIRTEQNEKILIDGGPDGVILTKLGQELGPFDRQIDLIILTHPHADHLDGLNSVLERYEVKKIIATGVIHTSKTYLDWLQLIKDEGAEYKIVKAGDRITLGELSLDVLYPLKEFAGEQIENLNNSSIVLKIEYEGVSALLTGDIEAEDETAIEASDANLKAEILKVAHHGSSGSSTQAFLEKVRPQIAVISVGKNNKYGHPGGRIIKRLENLGSQVWRTDQQGDLKLKIDDGKWEIME